MSRKKILIVGCGGIGCHLAPALSLIHDLVLMDGDNYEPKNFGRQFPALTSTENKAIVLSNLLQGGGRNVSSIPSYFTSETFKNDGYDLVISAVDNNGARSDIHIWCIQNNIPMIMAGNGERFGEAYLAGSMFNPFEYYEFPLDTSHNPARCNSDKVFEDVPQTVGANFFAAAATMQIMQSLDSTSKVMNCIAHSVLDLHGSQVSSVKKVLKDNGDYHDNTQGADGEKGIAVEVGLGGEVVPA